MRPLNDKEREALSLERIIAARETLSSAFIEFRRGVPGAVGQEQPGDVVIEAKRNLTALVQTFHGEQAFLQVLEQDA